MEAFVSLFSFGLVLLVLAWAIQLLQVQKKKKETSKHFIVVYCFGLILIVLDGLMQGLLLAPALNALALFVILLVLLKTSKK